MCQHILVKLLNIKFHENPFSDIQTDGQTDRHGEANGRISAIFRSEGTKKWQKPVKIISLHETEMPVT
jgi:hypothetical protein